MKTDNKIILTHLKMHWKSLLYFLVLITLFSILLLTFGMFSATEDKSFSSHFGGPFIGKVNMFYGTAADLPFIYSESVNNYYSKWVSGILFSGPTIVFLSIATVFFVYKIFLSEIRTGRIVSWATLPISKQKLFLMKILSIIIINVILTASVSLVILIFGSTAQDANKYFLRLFLYCLEFIIFNIFLSLIFISIGVLLIKKPLYINILIYTTIIIYIFTMWLLYYFYKTGGENDLSNPFRVIERVKFFTVDRLIINPLNFVNESNYKEWLDEYKYWWKISEYYISDNIYLNILIPMVYLSLSAVITYLCLIYIKKIDLFI